MTGTALSVARVLDDAATQVDDLDVTPRRLEALEVLVTSLRSEAGLSALGERLVLRDLAFLVANGARMDRAPEQTEPPQKAIVIASTPRSGSTLLHHLLAQDGTNRVLPYWEARFPVPIAPGDAATRRKAAAATIRAMHLLRPHLAEIHPIAAELPEECIFLMTHEFASLHFIWHFHVPTYTDWYLTGDVVGAYRGYRRGLRLLSPGGSARWVLKSFCHVLHADAMAAAFPDAVVVSLRRDPTACVPSLCLLVEVTRSLYSAEVDRVAAGRTAVRVLRTGSERFEGWRSRIGEDQVVDLSYRTLVADPLRAVAEIYERAGIALSPDADARMRAWLAEHHWRRRAPAYRYSLDDYGLTARDVRACEVGAVAV
jgi:hypothetical protein